MSWHHEDAFLQHFIRNWLQQSHRCPNIASASKAEQAECIGYRFCRMNCQVNWQEASRHCTVCCGTSRRHLRSCYSSTTSSFRHLYLAPVRYLSDSVADGLLQRCRSCGILGDSYKRLQNQLLPPDAAGVSGTESQQDCEVCNSSQRLAGVILILLVSSCAWQTSGVWLQ